MVYRFMIVGISLSTETRRRRTATNNDDSDTSHEIDANTHSKESHVKKQIRIATNHYDCDNYNEIDTIAHSQKRTLTRTQNKGGVKTGKHENIYKNTVKLKIKSGITIIS